MVTETDHFGCYAGARGSFQRSGIGLVGDDDGDMRANRRCVDQRLKVAARPGCENCNVDEGASGDFERGGSVGMSPIINTMSAVEQVSAMDWESWVRANGAVILDVREPDEWELGTLPGATMISQGEIIQRIGEVPKEKKVLCVCRSGARSNNVATFLAFNGYEAANLAGGMKALGMQN